MQEHRPVNWEFIWPAGDVQRLLTHCDTQGAAGSCEGAGLGAYMGGALEVAGVPIASAAGTGMRGRSSVCLSSPKRMVAMLGRSMSPISSSTLMRQVMRLRGRRRRKCMGIILYSATQ